MKAGIGRIIARLAEPGEQVSRELVALINANINPPSPVEERDVFIRAMYIISDEVNSFGGRFPREEYEHLCELLVDSPVMVGHRKDKLPIGRNFHATIVEKENRQWVKSYFYWLKQAAGAETLRENIDGGIYKECSIGFTFHFPECSICGKDIRTCEHEPLQTYTHENSDEICHFTYRKIERVLETSLVYRGAVPDTEISKELQMAHTALPETKRETWSETTITSPLELDPGKQYLVVPYYDGIPVILHYRQNRLSVTTTDNKQLPERILSRFATDNLPDCNTVFGYLLGFRGKERCPAKQVRKFIHGTSSPVTRLEIRLLPQKSLRIDDILVPKGKYPVSMISYCRSGVTGLRQAARAIMTRDGVRLWDEKESVPGTVMYCYQPRTTDSVTENIYTLHFDNGTGLGILCYEHSGSIVQLLIRQFNLSRFRKGGRFVADSISDSSPTSDHGGFPVSGSGTVVSTVQRGEGMILSLKGMIDGTCVVKPVKINDKKRYLFYLLPPEKEHV